MAAKYPDVFFGKVDTEAQQDLAGAFRIMSIPTLMIFRQGVLLFENSGVVPEAALADLITQVKGLDMDDVKKKIAEQEAAGEQG